MYMYIRIHKLHVIDLYHVRVHVRAGMRAHVVRTRDRFGARGE